MTDERPGQKRYGYLLKDLMIPTPRIYWCDFLSSLACLYGCFFFLALNPSSLLLIGSLLLLGSLFLYRCAAFLHEIVHLRKGHLPGFATTYNLLFGYVFKLPVFMYTPHLEHHSPRKFTTVSDPEYTHWGDRPLSDFVIFTFSASTLLPALLAVRLGVVPIVAPLLGRNVREWIYRRASTLATQRNFERKICTEAEMSGIVHQERMCALYNAVMVLLAIENIIPWATFLYWYVTMGTALAINSFRGSINHGYTGCPSAQSFDAMILDSFNVTSTSVWSLIWSPLDSKFHGLHHMFPTIPYHSLRSAHDRLMENLPMDHPYRKSNKRSYAQAFKELIWTRQFP
jgi:fatty acid desaturase